MQATLSLTTERGLQGVTIALIAREAQASPGIIYHYFESKDEIVHTLYRTIKRELGQFVVTEELFSLSPLERLKQVWLQTFHYYVTQPQKAIFLEQYKNSAYASLELDLTIDDRLMRLAQVVEKDITDGVIKDYPFQVLYELTIGVAALLAKQQINGTIILDPVLLEGIAHTCCSALII